MAIHEYKEILKLNPGPDLQAAVRQKLDTLTAPERLVAARVKQGRKMKTASYVLAGTGIALLAVGGVLTYLSGEDFDALGSAEKDRYGNVIGMSQARAASMQHSAESKQEWSWVMYGIGGAAVVTSVVLYVMGRSRTTKVPEVVAVPLSAGGMLGVYREF